MFSILDITPIKTWLTASLWYNLTYNSIFGNPGGLVRHRELLKLAGEKGINLRGWVEAQLEQAPGTRAGCDRALFRPRARAVAARCA
ncbi:MAG: hypothetical protein JXR94_11690 [Candidatus Hydrogenedentes bacterium]|nr:hypothetical protein [Candidatus Hydrogenedentota bacterium]